jgi:hypothetical protein
MGEASRRKQDARRRKVASLEQLKQIVANGPPPRPGKDAPGPLMVAFAEAVQQVESELPEGEKLDAFQTCGLLAQALDLMAWKGQVAQFEQIKAAVERQTGGGIVKPAGLSIVPR